MNFRITTAILISLAASASISGCATGEPMRESRFPSIQKSSVGGRYGTVSGEDYRRTTEANPDRYIPQRK